jgi:hypothetical protein
MRTAVTALLESRESTYFSPIAGVAGLLTCICWCSRQLVWRAVQPVVMSNEVPASFDLSNGAADFQVAGTSTSEVERVSLAGKKRLFADVETDRTFAVYAREHEGLLPCPYQVLPN